MYGVHRKSWVSMGDPVGPPERAASWPGVSGELADAEGDWARSTRWAPRTCRSISTWVSRRASWARRRGAARGVLARGRRPRACAHNRVVREGFGFSMLPREEVPAQLDVLERISDHWLAAKKTREKGFSVGAFDRAYLSRLPLAVVQREGHTVAFANVWLGGECEELSIDLMRYGDDAPPGVMDYLFAELMLWGKAQGYRHFSLGMAPLSGLEPHRFAPVWNRAGALLFRFGEHFYNFQGLRGFKEKFDPEWEPRYLAAPGGIALPFVLTHVAGLISGGVIGVVAR